MRHKHLTKLLLASLSFFLTIPSSVLAFSPGFLLSDQEMMDPFALDLSGVERILSRGTLAHYLTTDIDGRQRFASDIIWRAAQRNGISAKVILTMLQKEQSLVEDLTPKQSQFDWAMGYAVCDSCHHDTPTIQRFKGFAKQINSATLQLAEGYLTDLASTGTTVAGYGPGRYFTIDGELVYIENNATAALYTYTPHLHGNENFVKIFQRYFGQQYPTGSLLRDAQTGTVYLIQLGKKRPFFSNTALLSRYDDVNIVDVEPSALATYQSGLAISYPNYALLDNGTTVYLLVDDTLRPFASRDTLNQLGFTPDEPLVVTPTDLAGYEIGNVITKNTAYANGQLVRLPSGALFYIEDGQRHIVATEEIQSNRLADRTPQAMSPAEIESYREGQAVRLRDGTLVRADGDSVVYIISEGVRRPIVDETTFSAMGWDWADIHLIKQETLLVHPLGNELKIDSSFETASTP